MTTLDPVTWTNIVNHSGDTKGRTGTVRPQFFDLKITSDRLIFIPDYSGSMEKQEYGGFNIPKSLPSLSEEEKKALESIEKSVPNITTMKEAGDPLCPHSTLDRKDIRALRDCIETFREWNNREVATKLDILKKETIKTIFFLDCDVYFNVILFSTGHNTFEDELVQATWTNKKEAMDFIVQRQGEGATMTGDAMLKAYSFVEINSKGLPKFQLVDNEHPFFITNGADTVILFTDGVPTYDTLGGTVGNNRITEFFTTMKPARKVQINTIGFADDLFLKSQGAEFLKSLAENNYGISLIYK